ncbi:Nramp family divalent metal transporter [Natranaerobius thermophilus]|uniref:Natural resistance-associated macrophage protein n=1 Tax=Natranaerobius thermophilus (strain ATCC BAA-1301 / DSM 18059 / JW/NM-WN-LF) TaxID=457570 RepID=B2A1I7_NATTJ|nr:Nramp family divalent metal transporter [Natranaerobius thermophilus]ACB84727.1 natural resistance-associated macrophage protein [Natranaerobius thermophilus JW/NM-WN-LF]
MNFVKRLKNIGPGALVAAAFIGPGTVTTATVTGAEYGYTLLWALVFSIFATIVLQEMSMRVGIVSKMELGEALRNEFENPIIKWFSIILVVVAIGVGAAAFETGNILGGALGVETLTGIHVNIVGPVIGIIAAFILWSGSYKIVEKFLIGLVIVMSMAFIITALVVSPNMGEVLSGMFVPEIPEGGLAFAIGLIGTTVVPYNLFLHASAVQERWTDPKDLPQARFDTFFSIILGGIITLAIIVTASATFYGTGVVPEDGAAMAEQLSPLLGAWAKWFFAIGLFGAGLSSAVTAPLAGAYATAGALGWRRDLKGRNFRIVLMIILAIGVVGSGMGYDPVTVILIAQIANGIMLPIAAFFLIWISNNKKRLGAWTNGPIHNVLGIIVLIVAVILGLKSLYDALTGVLL